MSLASASSTGFILDLLELGQPFCKSRWTLRRDVALATTNSAILHLDLVSALKRVLHLLVCASPNSSLTLHGATLRVVGDLNISIFQSLKHRIRQSDWMNVVLEVFSDVRAHRVHVLHVLLLLGRLHTVLAHQSHRGLEAGVKVNQGLSLRLAQRFPLRLSISASDCLRRLLRVKRGQQSVVAPSPVSSFLGLLILWLPHLGTQSYAHAALLVPATDQAGHHFQRRRFSPCVQMSSDAVELHQPTFHVHQRGLRSFRECDCSTHVHARSGRLWLVLLRSDLRQLRNTFCEPVTRPVKPARNCSLRLLVPMAEAKIRGPLVL